MERAGPGKEGNRTQGEARGRGEIAYDEVTGPCVREQLDAEARIR